MTLISVDMEAPAQALQGLSCRGFSLGPVVVADFLAADECAEIIALGDTLGMKRARLSGGTAAEAIRAAGSTWFDDDTLPWFTAKMIRAISKLSQEYFPFDLAGFDEGFQLLRYEGAAPGQIGDYYDWHIDIGASGSTITRKLSLVLQLSAPTDYKGGILEVNMDGHVRAQSVAQGSLIAFPSFALHRVIPVVGGTRYSLAAWVHGPTFR
ncbi:MAG: 2OG-Fe(II) oxygenase [Alphaproteobacteria bacterium]|nr:2OG-Fe(II) oxygenase [Alphaproteobacteria bacterium]